MRSFAVPMACIKSVSCIKSWALPAIQCMALSHSCLRLIIYLSCSMHMPTNFVLNKWCPQFMIFIQSCYVKLCGVESCSIKSLGPNTTLESLRGIGHHGDEDNHGHTHSQHMLWFCWWWNESILTRLLRSQCDWSNLCPCKIPNHANTWHVKYSSRRWPHT